MADGRKVTQLEATVMERDLGIRWFEINRAVCTGGKEGSSSLRNG